MRIHPTAVVGDGADLAPDITVGPHVVIEEDVVVGPGTVLLAGSMLRNGSRVGARCTLGPYAVIGGEPMDTAFRGEPSLAVLEDEVELREFATVHRATGEGAETRVARGTMLMAYVHVSHNARVGIHVVLTNAVQLAGHSEVEDYAVLGAGAMVHQFNRVGAYAMLGGGSAALQDILPFGLARGWPARHFGLNRVGLQRNGISGERYHSLEQAMRALRRRNEEAFQRLAAESEDVTRIASFREKSRRGIARFAGGR